MASDLNTIILIGRLVRNPETRYTGTGKAVTTFTIANDKPLRFKDGQWIKQEANFFNITVWDKLAETCGSYLRTGRRVAITGRLEQRRFINRDGQKKVAYQIIANKIHFLEAPQKVEPEKEVPPEEIVEPSEILEVSEEQIEEPFEGTETAY